MIICVALNFICVIYSDASQLTFLLLDPQPWFQRSYELRLLSGSFLGIGSLVFFLELITVLGAYVVLCLTEGYFLKIKFLLQKWGESAKNEPNISFFEFIGKISHYFFRSLVCNKILYYLMYSCTSPING